MDLELSPGDYTVVTTISNDRGMFHNHIASEDNETSFGWENDIHNAYYEYDDQGNRTLVSGDERIHMPKADYPEYDDHDDHDDDRYHVMMALVENFTAYEDEDMTAPKAAGVIHTDFERGFIRAEVTSYYDYIKYNGELGAKDAGKCRSEGKEYIVNDGDVILFRFNV